VNHTGPGDWQTKALLADHFGNLVAAGIGVHGKSA
jgi:hypothetical protein